MRIISKKLLRDFYLGNVQSEIPLTEWYYKMKQSTAKNISQLRKIFNSADSVKHYTVFNIAGNNYRLITVIHYKTNICYVRACWTHAEYSKKLNQDKLKRGEL